MATNIDLYKQSLSKIYKNNSNDKLSSDETIENTYNDNLNPYEKGVGVVNRLVSNLQRGTIKGVEGIIDTGASILGNVVGIFNNNAKDNIADFVSTDFTSNIMNSKELNTANSLFYNPISYLANKKDFNQLKENDYISDLPDVVESTLDNVTISIGEMLPSIAIGGLGASGVAQKALSLGTFGASAMGNSVEEGLQNGNDLGTSTLYGALQGAKEVGTEIIGDKLFGSKIFGVIGNSTAKVGKQTAKTLVKNLAKESFGEGAEEVIGDFFEPLIKKITINKDTSLGDLYSDSASQMPMDFITGALSGVVMSGGQTAINVSNYGVEGARVQETIQTAQDTINEMNNLEKQGKLTSELKSEYANKLNDTYNDYKEQLEAVKNKYGVDNSKTQKISAFESFMNDTTKYNPTKEVINETLNKFNKKNNTNYTIKYDTKDNLEKSIDDTSKQKLALEGVEAYTDNKGTIYVVEDNLSSNKQKGVYGLITHELGHNMNDTERSNLNNEVLSRLYNEDFKKNDITITKDNWEQEYSKIYKDNIKDLSKDEAYNYILEEMTNDYLASKTTNYKDFSKSLGQNSIISKVLENIMKKSDTINETYKKGITKNDNSKTNIKYSKNEVATRNDLETTQNYNEDNTREDENNKTIKDNMNGVDSFYENVPKPKETDSVNSFKNYANISQDKVYSVAEINRMFDELIQEAVNYTNPTNTFVDSDGSTFRIDNTTISFTDTKKKAVIELFQKMNNKAQNGRIETANELLKTFGENLIIDGKSLQTLMNETDNMSYDKFTKSMVDLLNKQYEGGKASKIFKANDFINRLKTKINEQARRIRNLKIYNKQIKRFNKRIDSLKEDLKINRLSSRQSDNEVFIFNELKTPLEALSKIHINDEGYIGERGQEAIKNLSNAIKNNEYISTEDKEALIFNTNLLAESITNKITTEQLQGLNNVLTAIKHLNETYDEVFINEQKRKTGDCAYKLYDDTKIKDLSKHTSIRKVSNWFKSILDPLTNFKLLENKQNGFLSNELYNQLVKGENKINENKFFLLDELNDYIKNNKSIVKQLSSKNMSFNDVKISDSELIDLYMDLQNEDGYRHIVNGDGIVLKNGDTNVQYKDFNKEDSDNVIKYVETNYKDLIKIIKELYYTKSGKLYNEALKSRFGYEIENEKNYYHLDVDGSNFNQIIGDSESILRGGTGYYNPSFSKKRNKSKASIHISDILSKTSQFSEQLANYSAMSPIVQDINKILRYTISYEGKEMKTIDYLNNYVDNQFSNNLRELLINMQGLKTTSQAKESKILSKLRGKMAKFALGANVKVMLTQTTSYAMASSELRYNSLVKGLTFKADTNYMIDNSPYFKQRFTNNEVAKGITLENYSLTNNINKKTDVFTQGIKFFDMKTIGKIYNACICEIASNKGISVKQARADNSILKEALSMAEDVSRKTQPQYSALENGSITKNSGEIAKSLLMYTSVTRKFISNVVASVNDSILTGNKNKAVKAVSGLLASQLMLSIISQVFKQFLGKDDDDKVFDLDLLKDFAENSTVNLIPFVKDIYNKLVNGYDIDTNYFSIVNDGIDLITDSSSLTSNVPSERSKYIYDTSKVLGQLIGVPTKNITELSLSTLNSFNVDTATKTRDILYGTSFNELKSNISKAYSKGNYSLASTYTTAVFEESNLTTPNNNSARELARLYSMGFNNVFPQKVNTTITVNGNTYKLNSSAFKDFTNTYSEAQEEVDKLINSKAYSNLDDDSKAKYIKQIYNAYYNIAKYENIDSTLELSNFESALSYTTASNLISILIHCNNIKASSSSSKKSLVSSYLSSYNSTLKAYILSILGYI